MAKVGCEFGRLLQKDVNSLTEKLDKILEQQTDLFNHQSSRVPKEIVTELKTQWRIITILTGIVCASIAATATVVIGLIR